MSGGRPDAKVVYEALRADAKRLKNQRRLTYWCASERCLLLDAVDTPQLGTILLHQKRFKNSPQLNERRSSAAGRAASTFDGETHWRPQWYYLYESALRLADEPTSGQSLQCDHVGVLPNGDDLLLRAADFSEHWGAGHVEVRVRADGSMFVVS